MPKVRNRVAVTTETALAVIEAALRHADEVGLAVSATVVDRDLNLVAYARGNEAIAISEETSRRKANTAATLGQPSGGLPDFLSLVLPLAADNQLTNLEGGVPLVFDGVLAGAVGIAGGTPDQDAEIATFAAAAAGADTP